MQVLANQATLAIENARLSEDPERKERRLEQFVDLFMRLREQQPKSESSRERSSRDAGIGAAVPVDRESTGAQSPTAAPPQALAERLTKREREVLALVVEGLINKEIGRRLSLSPNTVKNHVANVTQKLGVTARTQAAVMALRLGLVC